MINFLNYNFMSINKIIQFLVPKEKKFFPLFEEAADNLEKAAILLNKLLLIYNTPEKAELTKQIKVLEEKGDHITHTIFDELNKTFITPFDREDVYKLNASMDDVLDYINDTALKTELYKPKDISPYALEMSEFIVQATREIKKAIGELKNLKNPQNIHKTCIRINEIENKVDDIYHIAISNFFENESDAKELIKKTEVIKSLERATDKAEDVADVLKSIIVKVA